MLLSRAGFREKTGYEVITAFFISPPLFEGNRGEYGGGNGRELMLFRMFRGHYKEVDHGIA
jgi:hypothetical protein